MTLDNDLLTLWCGALFLDETQIRDLIEQVQQGRNDSDAKEDAWQEGFDDGIKQEKERRDAEIADLELELSDARADLKFAEQEAAAFADKVRAAVAEYDKPAVVLPPPAGNVTPLRRK